MLRKYSKIYKQKNTDTQSYTKMKKNIKLKTTNFDTLLKEKMKSESFAQGYNEELTRLELSSKIKELRSKKKLTQEGFAKKAQMPQSVIARVESGRHTISLVTLNKIAHALGKKVALV